MTDYRAQVLLTADAWLEYQANVSTDPVVCLLSELADTIRNNGWTWDDIIRIDPV